ncbi:MATE family efflux transporter [Arcanobacterium pinnipediorum]|uniref:MATE family efflux transporter n=1 Tax=Arcanobacterium pinnipediorum TaxID=1503041 RepID=A0ABY5AGS0_9ACTO|nr:MATE family efflux transporter [Arcanobacterium pinnipediorum]USR79397.1 MATE family efflux transporter [Arcanobacterium pinnipediorum]
MANDDLEHVDLAIIRLALPSLGALLAEPLLVAVDTTMIGRLPGSAPLAGLSLASTILTTLVGLCIFLTYATTAATARAVGANRNKEGYRFGIDGIWLAGGLGIVLGLILYFGGSVIISWFNPTAAVTTQALSYLHASSWGLPGMLIVLAATGTLRGFADARTPFIVATSGALVNIPINAILIYVFGLGITGAGLGTALAQSGMAIVLVTIIAHRARQAGASILASGTGVLRSLHDAFPLIVRTLSLRSAILLLIAGASGLGTVALATNQIVMTVWNFMSYGLDSLATAAQILVGQALGLNQPNVVRRVLHRCILWGVWVGIGLGIVVGALSFVVPWIMSTDADVQTLSRIILWIAGLAVPLASLAFILDGVLIGAGDTRRLAWYMLATLCAFAPVAGIVLWRPDWFGQTWGMAVLWIGYGGVTMAVRAGTQFVRTRGDDWMHLAR